MKQESGVQNLQAVREEQQSYLPNVMPTEIPSSIVNPGVVQYYPKVDKKTHQVLLVPTETVRGGGGSSKQTSTKGPKHPDLQEEDGYYCEICPCNYSRKDQLKIHVMYNCLKTMRDFICEKCGCSYHNQHSVREHYYQIHKKVFLYHCHKCNEGFHFLSRKGKHKNACPNKDGKNIYLAMIDLDPKLEETFKRCIPVDVNPNPTGIPENVLAIVDEMRDEEEQECEKERQKLMQGGEGEDVGTGDLGTGDAGVGDEGIIVAAEVHAQDDKETKMTTDILTSLSARGQEGSVEDDDDGIERSNEDDEEIEVENN